ncbi:MAG: amidohydrolase family protein [Myxococcota bacterium]
MNQVIRAAQTFLSGNAVPDRAVVVNAAGTIVEVRPTKPGDPDPLRGLLVPGLVNAHLHLELSWAAGRVPGGRGLPAWVSDLMATTPPPDAGDHRVRAANAMVEAGTALVSDISNRGDTAAVLTAAGLKGIVQHEILGMHAARQADLRSAASAPARVEGGFTVRPSPHAPYSARADVIAAAAAPRPHTVGSLHLAEDPEEVSFLLDGSGAWASFLDAHGIDWADWNPPGQRPVAWLDGLGVLHDHMMVVHGVTLRPDEMATLADRGTALCLCPRSNLHITGELPDLLALLDAGLTLALGTDSLGSAPDLDVLGEVAVLVERYPEHAGAILSMATDGGARALRRRAGRIEPGYAPGLVLLEVDRLADLVRAPPRRWIVRPGLLEPA